ncbi:MAG: heme o synthase [Flavobacteriaceae bacterium]|nr:heme o synthase [Flavobacteriaceae bacterium]
MTASLNQPSGNTILNDIKQLTKFGLSISVVFSSVAGYLLGADIINYKILALLSVGGYLMVGASNAFNQVIEITQDAVMQRTKTRPLPAGRMSKRTALIIAFVFTLLGLAILYSINPKTAFFGALSIFLYTSVYTPLKLLTPLSVFVGAIPGAIPFMLGWVAATNHFGIEAGILFAIQFLWQFPHFWAIGWLLDADYKKAGFKMLPMGKKDKKLAIQIILYTFVMILVSVYPVLGLTGHLKLSVVAAVITVLPGVLMLYYGFKLLSIQTSLMARKLMLSSVFYITMIQIIFVIDKFLR